MSEVQRYPTSSRSRVSKDTGCTSHFKSWWLVGTEELRSEERLELSKSFIYLLAVANSSEPTQAQWKPKGTR
jgi:hypothetical protein